MKSINTWFFEYGQSHQNKLNKRIHWICVPLIFLSLIALFASIPANFMQEAFPLAWQPYIHFGTIVIILSIVFYVQLSPSMTLGILLFGLLCLQVIVWLRHLSIPLWMSSLTIFAVAWIGQLYGHKVEGKKPSFFKDLQFLLIGPAWLLGFIYKKLGINY